MMATATGVMVESFQAGVSVRTGESAAKAPMGLAGELAATGEADLGATVTSEAAAAATCSGDAPAKAVRTGATWPSHALARPRWMARSLRWQQ